MSSSSGLEKPVWKCHVCGDERPDEKISVLTRDKSGEFGFPLATIMENVRYCNDRKECIEGAKNVEFIKTADE